MDSFNNSEKGAVAHAIVHRALWEYLSAVAESEDEAEAEKLRREMFETCVVEEKFCRYVLTSLKMSRGSR